VLREPGALDEFRRRCREEPRVESSLIKELWEGDPESAEPVLRLLALAETGNRALTAIFPLVKAKDHRVRALASAMVAKNSQNVEWLTDAFTDPDPRVRANVIEFASRAILRSGLLEEALEDEHHRVVCNAVVRMFEINPERAAALLEQLTTDERPAFRAAAAWAVGATDRIELVELVRRMRNDPVPQVRWNALRSMVRLRKDPN
jgi:HEAT repeat protein